MVVVGPISDALLQQKSTMQFKDLRALHMLGWQSISPTVAERLFEYLCIGSILSLATWYSTFSWWGGVL